LRLDHPKAGKLQVTLRQRHRREHRQDLRTRPREQSKPHRRCRTLAQTDRLVPLDAQIRRAREVVDAAHETDLEMARAIYNHVVATVKYDKSGKGWAAATSIMRAETDAETVTDFHAIFIGYAARRNTGAFRH
jgi:hypothetical protein